MDLSPGLLYFWDKLIGLCFSLGSHFSFTSLGALKVAVGATLSTETAVWQGDVIAFMSIELALSVIALAISWVVNSRKTEFV